MAVYAQDFSVKGGTLGVAEGRKICHLMDKALDLKVPIIALIDSGGARIQEGVAALTEYGHLFRKTCDASGFVPQLSLILGPCAGGAVYCPALTDLIIIYAPPAERADAHVPHRQQGRARRSRRFRELRL